MENQSSRYRDNNERMRRALYEKRRRERQKRIFQISAICIAVIVVLGCFVSVKLFSGKTQEGQNTPKSESEVVPGTESSAQKQEGEATASQIDQAALKEIIAQAEKKAEAADTENNADGLETLNRRIQEAKDLISEDAPEDRLGVAYLNLILAINAIE